MEYKPITCNKKALICKLYAECHEQLLYYFNSYCHNSATAEDMVHTLFLKLMQLDVIRADTVHGLIFSTARNMVIDKARHRAHIQKVYKSMFPYYERIIMPSIDDKIDMDRILEIEASYISSMPTKRAEIYRLWRDDTMTAKEIATDMNISVRTVEHQIYLATKGIKDFFKKAM